MSPHPLLTCLLTPPTMAMYHRVYDTRVAIRLLAISRYPLLASHDTGNVTILSQPPWLPKNERYFPPSLWLFHSRLPSLRTITSSRPSLKALTAPRFHTHQVTLNPTQHRHLLKGDSDSTPSIVSTTTAVSRPTPSRLLRPIHVIRQPHRRHCLTSATTQSVSTLELTGPRAVTDDHQPVLLLTVQ